ncbi:MAG: putative DNA binding domain-containing protein [Deltaproteobacteria bacterium]|nr:putative DNA binding domain-containing protein [Deltaproteobacteria bacterium]
MITTPKQFDQWLSCVEDFDIEFKTAKNSFSKDKDLPDYCAALANEGGGRLILGVNDQRQVVGTKAFLGTHNKLSYELLQKLKIRVDVEEFDHPDGRVLIFHVPPRPAGQRIRSTGDYVYPMRVGESLVEMDDQKTREILTETQPDFTAGIVEGFTVDDLDPVALQNLRVVWSREKKRSEILDYSTNKILDALNLVEGGRFNYACLILLGNKSVLDRLLADAEIIFEWRGTPTQTHHDFRACWREPYFKIHDVIWQTINARNSRIPYQDGLFQKEVMAFDEKSVREAWLNAIIHRDYSMRGRSVFILANPQSITVESPGGFLPGVTPENVIDSKEWRNRRLAETLEKVGLVERSGQGMDDIFKFCIRDGKGLPDLSKSDSFSVIIKIPAQVQDKAFILFLEKVAHEKQILLDVHEIMELERVRCGGSIINTDSKNKFLKAGIIESVGRTSGTKYILSHRYYETIGQSGKHTRLKGLTRDQIKELILNHIRGGKPSRREDLLAGFSEHSPHDISNILQELKRAGQIIYKGSTLTGKWIIKR